MYLSFNIMLNFFHPNYEFEKKNMFHQLKIRFNMFQFSVIASLKLLYLQQEQNKKKHVWRKRKQNEREKEKKNNKFIYF